jgi:hypothetical protein
MIQEVSHKPPHTHPPDLLFPSVFLLRFQLFQFELLFRLDSTGFARSLIVIAIKIEIVQIIDRSIAQRDAQLVLLSHLDLFQLSSLLFPQSLCIFFTRLISVIPVDIFVVLPSTLRCIDRVSKIVFSVFIRLDIRPFEFSRSTSGA